ncbi:hypothetical protein RI543_002942 [Arxiozyma heterogenica]|uniref:Cytidyltransferase-like domain-containing protein n=1 Tax=Arxiozyma heterogenica TaxID=278026 RepID=A0AAN7WLS7_9SACH|nr:hypothetical protein RI543_002942 [Kazachstania heterogenica]
MVRIGFVLDHISGSDINWLFETIDEVLSRDNHSLEELLRQDYRTENPNNAIDILLLINIKNTYHLDDLLGKIYSNVRDILMQRDLTLLPLNVLLGNFNKQDLYWDHIFLLDPSILNNYDIQFGTLEKIIHSSLKMDDSNSINNNNTQASTIDQYSKNPNQSVDQDRYKMTAVGGTFDHIHDGHKILLTMAAFLTSKRLIIGLTDEELLVNKKFKECMESFSKREDNVLEFLHILKPQLLVDIIPLHDVCGPTGTVPEIECLIVSRETVKGGEIVNRTRRERGFNELKIIVVNVLGGDERDGWKEKLSSTEIRKILSTQASTK